MRFGKYVLTWAVILFITVLAGSALGVGSGYAIDKLIGHYSMNQRLASK